jgi:hypothetical protein
VIIHIDITSLVDLAAAVLDRLPPKQRSPVVTLTILALSTVVVALAWS